MRLTSSLAAMNAAVLACAVLAAAGAGSPGRPALAPAGLPLAVSAAAAAAADAVPALPTASPAPLPEPLPAELPTAAASPAPPEPPPAEPQAVPRPPRPAAVQRPAPAERAVSKTGWAPYAAVGGVKLHLPGQVVELVGLHQSSNDGAQPQQPLGGPAPLRLLDSRARDTNRRGAADIVVDPTREVRSPVTGTVLRAGTYTLYCDNVDQFMVIEPDARPGWQVKMLHFRGLTVKAGDRVEGGVTVVGSGARVLPFASQVDKYTAAPHWPHVHVEVVDPSVPDRPSSGTC